VIERATNQEIQAFYISSILQDNDRLFVGANLHVPRAGALLAHLTHAPNMKLSIGMVSTNLLYADRLEPTKFSTDYRVSRWAECMVIHDEIFQRPQYCSDVFFVGGMQIDRFGNTNLIGIKSPDGNLAVRGPGSLGTTTMAHYAKRYYIYAPSHSASIFVERVDYISTFGYGQGGDHRCQLNLNQFNEGPLEVITPLGIFDFNTPDHSMRLKHVHSGVSVEYITTNTGFEFAIAEDITETAIPDADALLLLRERVDVEGTLR